MEHTYSNNMKYKCHYTDGGGTEHNAGIWEKKETKKTISFKLIGDYFFTPHYRLIKINKFYSAKQVGKDGNYNAFRDDGDCIRWMNNGHVLKDWKDGTYTAYPVQCGVPYFFVPLVGRGYCSDCEEVKDVIFGPCKCEDVCELQTWACAECGANIESLEEG